jgi:hypothetical protein
MQQLSKILAGAALAAVLAGVGPAKADFTFSPTGGSTGDVVQFEQQFTNVPSFFGDANKFNSAVEFLTIPGAPEPPGVGPQTGIGTDGNGQADVVCNAGCNPYTHGGLKGSDMTNLEIKPGTGLAFSEFIGNLEFGTGTASIIVDDQFGNAFSYTLGNGSNFFTLTGIPDPVTHIDEVITDIKIEFSSVDSSPGGSGTFAWEDFKQPRITLCTMNADMTCSVVPPLPEPSTMAVLGVGLAGLGLVGLRRRRR